jgi:hypothetical protein
MKSHCVITTINPPTKAVERLHEKFGQNLIIVGDKKTPLHWNYEGVTPIREPNRLYAPDNHYARKNLGYLEAIRRGADLIYDTDDDNIPNENWFIRDECVDAFESEGDGWFNAYRAFSKENIWPRGFSLRHLRKPVSHGVFTYENISSIQQGLADGDPDVDAIWRLVLQKDIRFTDRMSVYLNPNAWCSFNSQSTWFFPKAFPLMYLPVCASFRMTDIYRSFVGQRCLWELGEGVTFHSPSEVFQDRNEHDLLKDFEQEVHGYLNIDKIVQILSSLPLMAGEDFVLENMIKCYRAIVSEGILPLEELDSLGKWITDYDYVTRIV